MENSDSRLTGPSRERRAAVEIVSYEPRFRAAFKALNIAWITRFFKMEAEDYAALDEPEEHILRPGGKIFVALADGVPVGVCSLINLRAAGNTEFDFELSKLAVSEEARGLGIGEKLCNAVISAARELGGRNVYLESNTVLVPAVSLYRKLGFREVPGRAVSPYERCNIRLALEL